MSDDWKPGDLAVCVDARPNPLWGLAGLTLNAVYTVTRVHRGSDYHSLYGKTEAGLELAGLTTPTVEGFAANRFRKIRPDDQAGSREDWALLIETHKQRVEA